MGRWVRGITLIEMALVVAIVAFLALFLTQKAADFARSNKRQEQLGGVAVVRQFTSFGEKMGEWKVHSFRSRSENVICFLTVDGKLITLSGNYVVEE